MKLRTSLRMVAAVAALALAATACGGDDDTGGETESPVETEAPAETESPAEDDSPTEAESPADDGTAAAGDVDVVNDGQLTVCSDIPYAPFEFEEGGEFTGFDIELMEAISGKLGLELNVNAIGFDPIQSGTALNSDQCDVAASAMTITEEREENLDFSEPYYNAEQSLLVPADSDIATLEDTSGASIGVQSATTGEQYARDNAPEDAEIVAFENPGDLFTAMTAGQVDAILQDLPVNAERAREDDAVEVTETYDTGEQYGFAVAEEGSDALLEAINGALQEVRDEGTYDELFQKYFGTE